jgi:Amt family ammonium transporter
MIAGASGCLTVFVLHFLLTGKYSLVMMCNGKLAGLVAGTAYILYLSPFYFSCCDNVEAWAAFIIGIMGGFTYYGTNKLLFRLKIDDPVDAIPIHAV